MSNTRFGQIIIGLLYLAGFTGCAKYEYELIKPIDMARHIGSKGPAVVEWDDLTYRLQTFDNRLVMIVDNPSEEAVKLIGEDSYVVDPKGESHPVKSRTIGPGSNIKLILPPPRPQYLANDPAMGVGFGVGVSRSSYRREYGYGAMAYDDDPQYYTLYDPADASYWSWAGEGTSRLTLAWQKGESKLAHEFLLGRKKM